MDRMQVSKITTTNMSQENACIEVICQTITVITLCIADLWSVVLKPDFLSTLCIRIAKLYIIQKYNTLWNSICKYELATWLFFTFLKGLLCVPIFHRHYKTVLRVGHLGTEFPLISPWNHVKTKTKWSYWRPDINSM